MYEADLKLITYGARAWHGTFNERLRGIEHIRQAHKASWLVAKTNTKATSISFTLH